MFIEKRYPLIGVINWSKKYLLYFLIIDSIPVILHHIFGWNWMVIPWQPIALIGIAVSFYLGFKNNSSYDRLWEARKIWGGIVNESRTFTIMVRDFINNNHAKKELSENELSEIHKTVVHRHVAWLKALTYQLRMHKVWEHDSKEDNEIRRNAGIHPEENHFEKLKGYISTEDYNYIMKKGNKASHLLSLQSMQFSKLLKEGYLEDFRHMEVTKLLQSFYALQGKSERIKNFPFPRQYATVNYIFVWIFILLLPFGMLNVFSDFSTSHLSFLAIPFTMLVSWVFILMEMIGDYSENPFEGLYNDVPISSMARSIEIDIRQMLEEENLPEPIKPIEPFNLMM